MNIELRQWYFGDEQSLINLYDHYDRSFCDYNNPEPGTCTESTANYHIRNYVDMLYDDLGYSRAVVLEGKVVGHVQITKRPDLYDANCDLDIYLLPEACGKGVGTWVLKEMVDYAFNGRFNFECLFVTVFEPNKAGARMCEKAGLRYCGEDDSCEYTLHGKPCRKVVYGIRQPKREIQRTGVEIKPWECRDIDYLLHLHESVDKRYDDIPNPLIATWRARSEEEIAAMDKEHRRQLMLVCMREFVDQWNIRERDGGDIFRAIVNDGQIVGLISLSMLGGKRSLDGRLGYMMMREHCGKGIATKAVGLMLDEVFRLRDLHRVTARVYAPNKASQRVLEKNGFQLEGVMREAVLCEGVPTDYLVYGLLKSEIENVGMGE